MRPLSLAQPTAIALGVAILLAGAPDTAATLQLVARLDKKLSAPFALRVKV